jgi:hypothetical protein
LPALLFQTLLIRSRRRLAEGAVTISDRAIVAFAPQGSVVQGKRRTAHRRQRARWLSISQDSTVNRI